MQLDPTIDWTYFLVMHSPERYVKIGRSWPHSLSGRLEQYKVGSPFEVELIGVISNTSGFDEKSIHKRFAHHRFRGEWFRLDQEILDFVRDNRLDEPNRLLEHWLWSWHGFGQEDIHQFLTRHFGTERYLEIIKEVEGRKCAAAIAKKEAIAAKKAAAEAKRTPGSIARANAKAWTRKPRKKKEPGNLV